MYPNMCRVTQLIKEYDMHTITMIGFVLIFLARAAYRNVFEVSERFDLAGDTHAICKNYKLI